MSIQIILLQKTNQRHYNHNIYREVQKSNPPSLIMSQIHQKIEKLIEKVQLQ